MSSVDGGDDVAEPPKKRRKIGKKSAQETAAVSTTEEGIEGEFEKTKVRIKQKHDEAEEEPVNSSLFASAQKFLDKETKEEFEDVEFE